MSTYCQPQSVSTQLSQIGTLDIIKGALTRPIKAKDKVIASQSDQYVKGFNPKDIAANWDSLSDLECATIKITLQEAFWNACHELKEAITLWIGRITIAANHLITAKQLPTDQQIADRLVGGLDNSWSSIRDTVVYPSVELSLDNTIGALEAHFVCLN
ncbi:hypothetical protein KEM48_007699, partial [Puccinia striiformis f. sp. tritici PST-130]